jgi:SAM-dependent methyltransferase
MNQRPNQVGNVDLTRLYRERFSDQELAFKSRMWQVLCERFFQRFVAETDTVLDLGAGSCEFINAIRCGRKIAVDLNPDTEQHARGAEVIIAPSTNMVEVRSGSVDVVFCSNFFEHLPDKESVLATLHECRRVLRAAGTLIVLQPNIRYLPGRYWDYFDHHTPLSHLSMVEALSIAGFQPQTVIPRFLPYTIKDSRAPRSLLLIRAYLRLRVVWPMVGRQMLIVARSQPETSS